MSHSSDGNFFLDGKQAHYQVTTGECLDQTRQLCHKLVERKSPKMNSAKFPIRQVFTKH